MAEFSEVMRQWSRICDSTNCEDCPLFGLSNDFTCTKAAKCYAKAAEEIIMRWAAEHQEPVYPTWYEWLNHIGVLGTAAIGAGYVSDRLCTMRIPADIAQKLGIEPKEG